MDYAGMQLSDSLQHMDVTHEQLASTCILQHEGVVILLHWYLDFPVGELVLRLLPRTL